MRSASEATKLEERGSDSVRTPFLHFMNTGVIRSEIYWGGVLPGGTFRFKKIDGSFWNGETFRFADYKSWMMEALNSIISIMNRQTNILRRLFCRR